MLPSPGGKFFSRTTMYFSIPLFTLLLASTLAACGQQPVQAEKSTYERTTTVKPYDDVLAELEVAITEQNFRITGHNHIGSVIRSRDHIDFPDYDTLQFCNLSLARQMLELSPASVIHMPCNVAVRSEQGRVIVATHLLPEDSDDERLNTFFRQMNEKLRRIVDFAVEQ